MAVSTEVNSRAQRLRLGVLIRPATFWLSAFFLLPFVIVIVYSFLTRSETGGVVWSFTLNNFGKLLSDLIYLRIFWRSVWLGIITTLLCLLVSYPLALFIVRQNARW